MLTRIQKVTAIQILSYFAMSTTILLYRTKVTKTAFDLLLQTTTTQIIATTIQTIVTSSPY